MQLKRFLGNLAKAYLAIGALSVSAYAVADDWNCAPQPCAPSSCNSCDCWGQAPAEPPCYNWGYNPPAYLRCGNPNPCSFCDNLRLDVEYLWWRACSQDIDLGYEETFRIGSVPTNGTAVPTQSLRLKSPKDHFQSGFRVGLDYISPCCGWDGGLYYTHFHSKARASAVSAVSLEDGATATDGVAFRPLFETVANSIPDVAEGRWTLNLDYLDLEIGHKYYVSSCFVLRPFIGLRGARINQSYDYRGFADRTATLGFASSSDHFASHNHLKNNFLGVGPRVGLDVDFELGCGLVLFGEAGASIMFGRFERHSNEIYNDFTNATLAGQTWRFNQHAGSERCSASTTDLSIGLEWNRCFCFCGCEHPVSIAFAWEHHGFYDLAGFNFNENTVLFDTNTGTPATAPSSNGGAIDSQKERHTFYTQGLTVRANFGF